MSAKHEWLNLVEVSGPFLAVPVLREVFPQGLDELETARAQRLRGAYEEWREAVDCEDAALEALHLAWIEEVLHTALDVDQSMLKRAAELPSRATSDHPEHDHRIVPDVVIVDPTHGDDVLCPVHVFPPDTDLDASKRFGGLMCSPADRMALHLRALGLGKPFGLVTNGERWMLVHAPVGQVSGFASWYARLWGQEPETLRAFCSLLGARRFFAPEDERLAALYERSLAHQDEVTDALGEQVRRAVEVLVQALDRADQDRNRELLRDVEPKELYEAGLTVMMRLVFLLAAEERGLLLLGEPRYDSFYAISTLRMQLRPESDEILERRRSAWSRLLAVFRAVYGGVEHPTLRLPALGGSLFDPDRFPFLEGRKKATSWRSHRAEPLPIDDRTVLLLLDAIQTFEGRTLSYRALDVEQIGHVYEGLLERTVERVGGVTLELEGTKSAKEPQVQLAELESARLDGEKAVVSLLRDCTKRSKSALTKKLGLEIDGKLGARLLAACRGDVELRDRLEPYAHLLRTDPWGYPLVYPKGAFAVVLGADRRETGTHYTPKSLTEKIVEETLTPLVYEGPATGAPRAEWKLKEAAELLDLKVCDPAMGSGAFLVQACRFLAARLVESWALSESSGGYVDVDGRVHGSGDEIEPLPAGEDARAEHARRLVVERCLYGVDLNPLAVELAKLSLWLVTLSKGRPFGFLDHNLRPGDSLLGIHRLDQLTKLSMTPDAQTQERLFGKSMREAVDEAMAIRQQLRAVPIRDIRDVAAMADLDAAARAKVEVATGLADAFAGTVFAATSSTELESRIAVFASAADQAATDASTGRLAALRRRAVEDLNVDAPSARARSPFHWPLEFPEVFVAGGFDSMVGNPPFMGGRILGRRLGMTYQEYLKIIRNDVVGSPDLCAYFFLRAFALLRPVGHFGLLATKSISETGSRVVCLDQIIAAGGVIYRADSRVPWPGRAAVVVAIVWASRSWKGSSVLDGADVSSINGGLEVDLELPPPKKLKELKGRYSQGQTTESGFILSHEQRTQLLLEDPTGSEVIVPVFNGADLNTLPELKPYRWIIYFRDWPEERARKFAAAFSYVERHVKPRRDSLTGQIHQDCFWKFWDLRPSLMKWFAEVSHVLAMGRVTKHLCVSRVTTQAVYNDQVKVLFFEGHGELAVLQSTIHDAWTRWRSGTLGAATLRYSTTAVLETWPMPTLSEELEEIGQRYSALRDEIRRDEVIGLTDLYNRFHDVTESSPRIDDLRALHQEMDSAVLAAFGWSDLDLELDFREVSYLPENDRVRLTLSERARAELLRRLCDLNQERHADEAASGKKGSKPRPKRKRRAPDGQLDLEALDRTGSNK